MNDGERRVGVVGDPPAELVATIETAGARPEQGDLASVLEAEPDLLVAVGEGPVLETARSAPDVPILPLDAATGFRSVPRDSLGDAVERALDGAADVQSHPVLAIDHDGERVGRAVADVTLLTAEVAHISEYAVTTDDELVAQFRADGVVVATPAGSPGYARRVGCPLVTPGTGVGAVAPIAPFATDPDHWILPLADVELTVERDETTVTLLADERETATVRQGEPVSISPDGSVEIAILPESRPRFR